MLGERTSSARCLQPQKKNYETSQSAPEANTNIDEHLYAMQERPKPFERDPHAMQQELQETKKDLLRSNNENRLLGVKIRRMEEMLKRKHRIVDMHCQGPHNGLLCKEAIAQMNHKLQLLHQENTELKEILFEKDHEMHILRRKMNTCAAYKPNKRRKSLSSSASSSSRKTTPKDEKHLQLAIDSQRNSQTGMVDRKEESPHEEIERLHIDFNDIVDEISKLKQTVVLGSNEQTNIKTLRTCEESRMSEMAKKKTKKTVKQSGFARISPKCQQAKPKKRNPFAIRTSSQTSLMNDDDLKMHIHNIVNEMNRDDAN